MATLGELNIKIAANVAQLTQDVTKVEREMRKMRNAGVKASKQMNTAAKAVTGFKKLLVGVVAVTAAWRVLSSVVSSSMQAFQTQEDAEKALEAALGEVNQELLDQAAALQKVTRFGDEAIIGAQALIGSFVKEESQIKQATAATLDLAQAKGMDLKAAADLMSKTLGSSTNAMSRYGIEVHGAVGSTERLNSLTGNIAKVFGGQAAAAAETMGGRLEQMNNAWGDMQEVLVKFIAPALTSFAEKMTPIIAQISEFIDGIREARDEAKELQGQFGEGGLFGLADTEGDEPGQLSQTRRDISAKAKQIAVALKIEQAAELAVIDSAAKAAEAQRLTDHLGELLAQEQAAWGRRLDIETDKERMHQRQLARDKEEKTSSLNKIQTSFRVSRGILSSISQIASASKAGQKTRLKIAKAQGTVDAISGALTAFGTAPYPYNYIAAGLALAAGMSKVSQMGSGSASGMGTAPEPPAPDLDSLLAARQKLEQLNTTQTTIVFQGGTFIGGDRDTLARELTPAVEQALSDGVR